MAIAIGGVLGFIIALISASVERQIFRGIPMDANCCRTYTLEQPSCY